MSEQGRRLARRAWKAAYDLALVGHLGIVVSGFWIAVGLGRSEALAVALVAIVVLMVCE